MCPVSLDVLFMIHCQDSYETEHDKMTFANSEDSDQPGHPPSLIRVFTVRFMGS